MRRIKKSEVSEWRAFNCTVENDPKQLVRLLELSLMQKQKTLLLPRKRKREKSLLCVF